MIELNSGPALNTAHPERPLPPDPPSRAAAWYRAMTLPERAASLASLPRGDFDGARAERRARRWRSQAPFADDAIFARRLALDHIDTETLLLLLGEAPESLRDRVAAPPGWLVTLLCAFDRHSDADAPPLTGRLGGHELSGFLHLAAPLIAHGRERLREGVQALCRIYEHPPFDEQTVENLLLAGLPNRLLTMLSRTLALELHVARLEGLLQGDTPEERFQSFVRRLSQRDVALAILAEYPVLARQLVHCVETSVQVGLETLQRLCADWDSIRAAFAPGDDPGVLTALEGGAGDQHRGGRSVLVATFSSGLKVVYKPKSMAVDLHFQELLAWLNERGDHPPLRTLKIIDRGTHGWAEHVTARECATPDEVRRFYERQGNYLALFYALESTDFHFENLIAAGEHPVMIDLEALFHPRVGDRPLSGSDELAGHTLLYSVLRVGLLPQRAWASGGSEGIDISGLGASAGQLTPHALPRWQGAGTDRLRLARERVELGEGRHRPRLNGGDIDVLHYAEQIIAGFTSMYRLLQTHRDELLAPDGPLARFADDEVRVILRPTRTYAMLLDESFHPDVLRDALDRDRLFDRLWAGVEHNADLDMLVAAERADLYNGDIPMFTTTPSSRDLWSSAHGRIAGMLAEPGLASVHRRMGLLSETDLQKQRWFIRASLATLAPGDHSVQPGGSPPVEGQARASRAALLQAARAVGDHLELLALRGAGDASWIGLTYTPTAQSRWLLAPLGPDLYNGLSGVMLFLAYLGGVAGERRYTALAQDALSTLRRQIAAEPAPVSSIGGFDGWGGIIYALAHVGALWSDRGVLAEAEALVERIPPLLAQDMVFDVMSGAAGCIGGLLSLHGRTSSQRVLAVSVQCGDWLLRHARPQARGVGWCAPEIAAAPLAGFSHGAAGIASMLFELAEASGEARFREAALDAIRYERTLFAPGAQNWRDLRAPDEERYVTAWCHGAPGIGLGRVQALRHLDDAEIRAEIEAAVKTTRAAGFGGNHSLCHGELGNLELLLQASLTLNDATLCEQTYRIAAGTLGRIDTGGRQCGVPFGVETPGLMTGLAGIGYGLLRLAEPRGVPSVLALAPPPHTARAPR